MADAHTLKRTFGKWANQREFLSYYMSKQPRHEQELQYRYGPREDDWTRRLYRLEPSRTYVCGRTPFRWLLLLIFFVLFYTGLVLLFAICMFVFFYHLPQDIPRVVVRQPGFVHEPHSIVYRQGDDETIAKYVADISAMLAKYGDPGARYGPCTHANGYGIGTGNPCVFMRLNRAVGFHPDCYDHPNQLPPRTPKELRARIRALPPDQRRNRIWFTCNTSMTSGKAGIYFHPRSYVPAESLTVNEVRGFDEEDFERILAVQVTNVPLDESTWLYCIPWAKNMIYYDNDDPHQFRMHMLIRIESDGGPSLRGVGAIRLAVAVAVADLLFVA